MEIPPLLIQFGGSIIAILAIYLLARAMGLGTTPKLTDEAAVQHAANEVKDGFSPVRIAIARGGAAALARDVDGQIMVIKRHGNQFVGRVLTRSAKVCEVVDAIEIDPRETQFGTVRLSIVDPGYWADAINRL